MIRPSTLLESPSRAAALSTALVATTRSAEPARRASTAVMSTLLSCERLYSITVHGMKGAGPPCGRLLDDALNCCAHIGGTVYNGNAGGAKGCHLLGRRPLAAGDDRTGMAHPASGRRGLPGDEADNRLLEIHLDPRGRIFLGAAADFPDHNDGVCFGVGGKQFEGIDMRRADQRVAANSEASALPHPAARELMDCLVGERSALRNDADSALAADVRRDDAGFRLPG